MVSMTVIKATNEAFQKVGQSENLVGLFVGATSGIGEHAMKAFARYTNSPTIYFVGRSQPDADRIISEITQSINSTCTIIFLKTPDLTSIKNVDDICNEIKSRETYLNILCMSQGYLSFSSRTENPEGLDKRMSIVYYGRMRFIFNLLPLLQQSGMQTPRFRPQILSVLAPGTENADKLRELINKNDIDLRDPNNFSPWTSITLVATLTSLSMEELSIRHPDMDWTHINPGVVITKVTRDLPLWVRVFLLVLRPLIYCVSSNVEEVGEGCMYLTMGRQEGVQQSLAEDKKSKFESNLFLVEWNGGEKKDWRKNVKKDGWEEERKQLRDETWKALNEILEQVDGKLRNEERATNAAEAQD